MHQISASKGEDLHSPGSSLVEPDAKCITLTLSDITFWGIYTGFLIVGCSIFYKNVFSCTHNNHQLDYFYMCCTEKYKVNKFIKNINDNNKKSEQRNKIDISILTMSFSPKSLHLILTDVIRVCGPPNEPWYLTFLLFLTSCSYVPGLKYTKKEFNFLFFCLNMV